MENKMLPVPPFPRAKSRSSRPKCPPENTYALILAGGSGTRFWPLSRNARPKQLLDLFGNGTLLEQTIRRLDGLVPPKTSSSSPTRCNSMPCAKTHP
jgi:molybdopterin-guanine dinucleotide biosynthesis protein A